MPVVVKVETVNPIGCFKGRAPGWRSPSCWPAERWGRGGASSSPLGPATSARASPTTPGRRRSSRAARRRRHRLLPPPGRGDGRTDPRRRVRHRPGGHARSRRMAMRSSASTSGADAASRRATASDVARRCVGPPLVPAKRTWRRSTSGATFGPSCGLSRGVQFMLTTRRPAAGLAALRSHLRPGGSAGPGPVRPMLDRRRPEQRDDRAWRRARPSNDGNRVTWERRGQEARIPAATHRRGLDGHRDRRLGRGPARPTRERCRTAADRRATHGACRAMPPGSMSWPHDRDFDARSQPHRRERSRAAMTRSRAGSPAMRRRVAERVDGATPERPLSARRPCRRIAHSVPETFAGPGSVPGSGSSTS